jgi:hypothetical protein
MKNNKLVILALLFASVFGSSCLKDKGFDEGTYGVKIEGKSVLFAQSEINVGVTPSITPTVYKAIVLLASSDVAPASDLAVSIAEKPSLLAGYSGTGTLTPFPAGSITFPASTTIKAGKYFDTLSFTIVNGSLLDLSKTYGIGLTLKSADGGFSVAGNKGDILLVASVKNIYDGNYQVLSGLVTRYTAPGTPANDALSGPVGGNPDLTLKTISANTCEISNLRWSGGALGVAGIDNLRLTVDPSTNLVTMQSLLNGTLTNWAGKVNSYDPANKVFKLAFRWNPTANVREYEMVIKKR